MPVPSHPMGRFPLDSHRNDIPMDKPVAYLSYIFQHAYTADDLELLLITPIRKDFGMMYWTKVSQRNSKDIEIVF